MRQWQEVWAWAGYPLAPLSKPTGGRVHRLGHDDEDKPRTKYVPVPKKVCVLCKTPTGQRKEVKVETERKYIPLCPQCDDILVRQIGSKAIPSYLRERMDQWNLT